MSTYFEEQQANREKAKRLFNEFLNCFMEADSEFRGVIGKDIITLMALKANTDEEFNKSFNDAFELMKMLSELRFNVAERL